MENQHAEHIDLDADEYLGRNTVAVYDERNHIILIQIYYRKLIIFLEVLKCSQSLMFQGFPAFLVTEDVLKSP